MSIRLKLLSAIILLIIMIACDIPSLIEPPDEDTAEQETMIAKPTQAVIAIETIDSANLPANLLQPGDLVYVGAFRLPADTNNATDAKS
jgi:hypothetical protein